MRKHDIGFAIVGSSMSIVFFMIVNFLTSKNILWFVYPSILLLIWPIGLYCLKKEKYKYFSLSISTLIIIFLIIENILNSPEHLWFLYAIFPIIWWPILVFLGKKAGTLAVAWIGAGTTILYYSDLNILLSPGYPWAVYPAFVVLWWPLSLYHARRKTYFAFSIQASVLISAFFITVNIISSPNTIWAVYPIFCVLWWPLSMYYFVYKRSLKH
ncbi:hypothetical protein [Fredinandcohnia quinoae]|uniref:Uncharacterized protein n=1 Tax=Fredinandcohnia quinoae TaxID=2918902 RepID=A0AAW5E690_9BACI|nr:hypothetical protein [Fredinandcohnia sp. SECRCQ15]MCH1626389.1 hypothetical protein [Fredinandcohnia sp. SECRCQ15]